MKLLKKSKVMYWTLFALVAGIVFGFVKPEYAAKTHILAVIFLKMIKMIIAPLLFSTLVVGIAGHDDIKSLGKIGLKTFIYFEIVTTLALILGLLTGNIFKPGVGTSIPVTDSFLKTAENYATQNSFNSLYDMIINIVPESITEAMASGNLLQIVFFAIFFALAACAIGQKAKPVISFLESVSDIMFKFTGYVMWFSPLGVFGAIASIVAQSGPEILISYAKILGCLVGALLLFISCVWIFVCTVVKVPLLGFFKALADPILLAFSTASSEAALPKAMDVLERFGVPKNIVGFVMPFGYTFNLDGSTIYLSLAVLFSTQIVGIDIGLKQQIIIILTLMLTSKGIAGVPRVALVVLAGTLASFNYPIIGVAILLGIDQILDMGRTTVNLMGNCAATLLVSKWDKQFDYSKMSNFFKEENIKVNKKYLQY